MQKVRNCCYNAGALYCKSYNIGKRNAEMKYILGTLGIIFLVTASINSYAMNDTLQKNKDTVIAFYEAAINNKDFVTAEKYMGSYYKQHNPLAEDGKKGFKKFIQYLQDTYPNSHSDIKRVMAEDDYVILHVNSIHTPNTRGNAIVDIFRLEDGKIVEHWDVIQPVPDQAANDNGMF